MSQRVPSVKSLSFKPISGDVTMYPGSNNIYNSSHQWNNGFLQKPFRTSLFDFQLDGLNCGGVPTRTTPTLTPTTLRNIEQTFIELQSSTESHQNEAGFVPPVLQPSSSLVTSTTTTGSSISQGINGGVMIGPNSSGSSNSSNSSDSSVYMSLVDTKSWQGGSATVVPPIMPSSVAHSNIITTTSSINSANNTLLIPPHVMCPVTATASNTNTGTTTTRRNIGGRRPNKENGLSPEEEERRKLRRERNKLAAARCRKRRLDHTNELIEETEDLESKKQSLQEEIQQLQMQKEELEFLLEAHKPCCKMLRSDSPEDVKPFLLSPTEELNTPTVVDMILDASSKPNPKSDAIETIIPDKIPTSISAKVRPSTLPVTNTFMPKYTKPGIFEIAGIPISTPSSGLNLNFETLLEGGTGLTPITTSSSSFVPSCATQQRSSNNVDLTSPDSVPTKLVSL